MLILALLCPAVQHCLRLKLPQGGIAGCRAAPSAGGDGLCAKLAGNVQRDRKVRSELKRAGWTIPLVLWECVAAGPGGHPQAPQGVSPLTSSLRGLSSTSYCFSNGLSLEPATLVILCYTLYTCPRDW